MNDRRGSSKKKEKKETILITLKTVAILSMISHLVSHVHLYFLKIIINLLILLTLYVLKPVL